ncbi:cysteine dioxygenase [Sodalis sp. RH22]|uniref:cysteine dioxygenase family protein n=1 Tax=unclassified Sodalis (in: enterobacteria) TaxID=2636512 RepID=UPI0039B3F9E3
MTTLDISGSRRQEAVNETLRDIRGILGGQALSRSLLEYVTRRLERLAQNEGLFSARDFPAPAAGGESSARYRLNADDGDNDIALYLNVLLPDKNSVPHNHTTWAAIAAVEGQELNRIYERRDDRSRPDRAELHLLREIVVEPGTPIAFLPDDIHSIHVTGNHTTRHLHLYGRPLETLVRRVAFDPATGAIANYNATQMAPDGGKA